MKKIIVALLVFSTFQLGYSQKKELKAVDKQVKSADYENALLTLESIKVLVQNIESGNSSKDIIMLGDFNFPFLKWNKVNENFINDREIISEEKEQASQLLKFSQVFFLRSIY